MQRKAMAEVTSALDRLTFSLGEYRLEMLGRESDQRNVDPVYEFPREVQEASEQPRRPIWSNWRGPAT